jgi:hypothetical protein
VPPLAAYRRGLIGNVLKVDSALLDLLAVSDLEIRHVLSVPCEGSEICEVSGD